MPRYSFLQDPRRRGRDYTDLYFRSQTKDFAPGEDQLLVWNELTGYADPIRYPHATEIKDYTPLALLHVFRMEFAPAVGCAAATSGKPC